MFKYTITLSFLISVVLSKIQAEPGTTCSDIAKDGQMLLFSFCDNCADEKVKFTKVAHYRYIIEHQQEVSWFEAAHICRTYGAHLASIETADEMNTLSDYLHTVGYTVKYFWLSGNDINKEGSWFWLGTGNSFGYTAWSGGQPDNVDNTEHCLHLWDEGDKYTWNDMDCKKTANYICEKN